MAGEAGKEDCLALVDFLIQTGIQLHAIRDYLYISSPENAVLVANRVYKKLGDAAELHVLNTSTARTIGRNISKYIEINSKMSLENRTYEDFKKFDESTDKLWEEYNGTVLNEISRCSLGNRASDGKDNKN